MVRGYESGKVLKTVFVGLCMFGRISIVEKSLCLRKRDLQLALGSMFLADLPKNLEFRAFWGCCRASMASIIIAWGTIAILRV